MGLAHGVTGNHHGARSWVSKLTGCELNFYQAAPCTPKAGDPAFVSKNKAFFDSNKQRLYDNTINLPKYLT